MTGKALATSRTSRAAPRWLAAALVAATFSASACGGGGPTPVPLDRERVFTAWSVAAHAPTGFSVYSTTETVPEGGPIWVSNVALPDPCAPQGGSPNCREWPPIRLPVDGVVMAFAADKVMLPIPLATAPVEQGTDLVVNGFRTRLLRSAPTEDCALMGGDESVGVVIPTVGDWTGRLTVEACIRGPDIGRGETAVVDLVRAATPAS